MGYPVAVFHVRLDQGFAHQWVAFLSVCVGHGDGQESGHVCSKLVMVRALSILGVALGCGKEGSTM